MKRLSAKEVAMVEACYFQPHYSSNASSKFWREIADDTNERTLYDFACALQDVEARVLGVLNATVKERVQKIIVAQRRKKAPRRDRKEAGQA